MGRKDAASGYALPVDQYRKEIGRHERRKARNEAKAVRKRTVEKKLKIGSIKYGFLILLLMLCTLFVAYVTLYAYISNTSASQLLLNMHHEILLYVHQLLDR